MSVTYYVVVPFDRDEEGTLKPGEAQEAPNANIARRRAGEFVETHAGAIAFSRAGDPSTGEFEDAVVLVSFGDVDMDALSG